jgi:hypothetical protein
MEKWKSFFKYLHYQRLYKLVNIILTSIRIVVYIIFRTYSTCTFVLPFDDDVVNENMNTYKYVQYIYVHANCLYL